MIHNMKSWPRFFEAIVNGEKKHDIRSKDRDFKIGDTVVLHEFDPFTGQFSGRKVECRISYITSNDTPCALSSVVLDRDYCVLSLEPVKVPSMAEYLEASMKRENLK